MKGAGGRPSKLMLAARAAAADARQPKLEFHQHTSLTFTGPVHATHLSITSGSFGSASSSSAHAGAGFGTGNLKRRRPDEVAEEDEEDDEEEEGEEEEGEEEEGEEEEDDEVPEGGADDEEAGDVDAVHGAAANAGAGAAPELRPKRRRYSDAEKKAALKLLDEYGGNQSATVRKMRTIAGYGEITRQHLIRWSKPKAAPNALGRKVEAQFERDVLDNLMFSVMRDVDGEQQLMVVANTAYTYETIRDAAREAQKAAAWQANEKVGKLQFSNKWVVSFLRRMTLRRRRVTTTDKAKPSTEAVRAHMRGIQDAITAGGYEPCDIINGDETGIFFGAKPKNQYVPKDAERASAPDSNDKARFTALMWGAADGTMGPPFIIVKNAVTGADQTSSTCLNDKHLMAEHGFRATDGWEHKVWSKEMVLMVKGKSVKATYKRNYIINTATKVVITANSTAWMDSVTMAMWVEVQLGPWATESGRPKLLVMDNCGPHSVPAVQATFAAQGIAVQKLPPNMTGELQVMDLVVNGPLKAAIRRERCRALHLAFLSWKAKWAMELLKDAAARRMPPFEPPKPSQAEGLRTLLATCENFKAPAFKDGLRRSFVAVGLRPDAALEPPAFRNYTGHGRRGALPSVMAPADAPDDGIFRVGDVAAELEMEARPEDAPDIDEDVDGDLVEASSSAQADAAAPVVLPAAAGAGAAVAPAAAVAVPKPSVTKVAYLKDEFTAAYVWHNYLEALSTGSRSIMAKRLDKLRGLVTGIISQYQQLERPERVKLWENLMAGADAAIAAGTAVDYELDFAKA